MFLLSLAHRTLTAHLAHGAILRDAGPPGHRCPQCNHPAPWEQVHAAVDSQARDVDLAQHHAQEEDYYQENPWRRPEPEVDFTTPEVPEMARIVARAAYQSHDDMQQHNQDVLHGRHPGSDPDRTPRAMPAVAAHPATYPPATGPSTQQPSGPWQSATTTLVAPYGLGHQPQRPSPLNPNAPTFQPRGLNPGRGRGRGRGQ
ncbi:MAG: hypothetical protein Q9222_004994 [Ikaeria aurantiellina]